MSGEGENLIISSKVCVSLMLLIPVESLTVALESMIAVKVLKFTDQLPADCEFCEPTEALYHSMFYRLAPRC